MDNLIAVILSTDAQNNSKKVYSLLSAASTNVLLSNTSSGQHPLHLLDPASHTVAYLFILNAHMVNADRSAQTHLLGYAHRFAISFNPAELVCCSSLLVSFAETLTLCLKGSPKPLVAVLLAICHSLDTFDSCITPMHHLLLRVCILAKNYRAAVRTMEASLMGVASSIFQNTATDFLLYFYYGGIAYVGLKRFVDAKRCFEICLNAPTVTASHIQVEAFKKHTLVSLLATGEQPVLLKSISLAVQRACRLNADEYRKFADDCGSLNIARAQAKAKQCADLFKADSNTGLVNQILADMVRRKIQQLTLTYLTLSLAEIGKNAGFPADDTARTESLLLKMIADDQIYATISHRDNGMVSFHDMPSAYDGLNTTHKLETLMFRTIDTEKAIVAQTWKIRTSQVYIERAFGGKAPRSANSHRMSSFDDDLLFK